MDFTNNLSLALHFDPQKKFLLCGELLNFQLKVSSPDFSESPDFDCFLNRIGAAVEEIDISFQDDANFFHSSSSFSVNSPISSNGRRMKSVESLSNLLKDTHFSNHSTHSSSSSSNFSHSKDSQNSHSSMASVTARRRFDSLGINKAKATWDPTEEAVIIPLEAFIDPEVLLSSHKATAKFKISLNELVPIDMELLALGTGNEKSESLVNGNRLVKIGQTEKSFTVLRPIEVSLRTHRLSTNQILLQLNIEFDHREFEKLLNCIEIESVDIILSDSFTSRCSDNVLDFTITPLSNDQIPFRFDTSPQTYSLIYRWTVMNDLNESLQLQDDFRLRAELQGKLINEASHSCSSLSLSFESALPIANLFPQSLPGPSEPYIAQIKLIDSLHQCCLKVYEPFEVEVFICNPNSEPSSVSFELCPKGPKTINDKSSSNPIEAWFHLEKSRKTPRFLLMKPLETPLYLGSIKANSFKSVRLQFIAMQRGIINLFDEFRFLINGKKDIKANKNNIHLKIE